MSTLKRKFELLNRITALGFTFEESQQLRRISMTLSKWAEAECNGDIERDEKTGKAFRVFRTHPSVCYNHSEYSGIVKEHRHAVADREAGALKRLKAIILARNTRECMPGDTLNLVTPYHQSDPRGCALYLVKASDLPASTDDEMRRHSGEWPLKSEETRLQWKLSCYYTRGLAVCA